MVENFIFPLTRPQFDELVRKIDGVSNQRLNYNQFMFKIKKGGLSRETPVLGRVTPASDTLDNVVSKLQQKVNRIVAPRFGLWPCCSCFLFLERLPTYLEIIELDNPGEVSQILRT